MSKKRMTRRDFLLAAGIGTAATLVGCAAPATPAPAATTAPTQAPAATAVPPTAVPPTATTAPTKAPTVAAPKTGGTFIEVMQTSDLIWDPYWNNAPSGRSYILYDRLFDYSGKDIVMPEPSLCESFTEDDSSITMKLRQGIKFHSGRELTSEDVLASVARAQDATIGHHLTDTFKKVDKAEAVDKYTVKMTWKTVYPLKREDLTKLFIIAADGMAELKQKPAGSGPWMLKDYQPGSGTVMVKNADYWRKPYPYMDGIQTKFIDDVQSRLANLQSGQVDQMLRVPYADVVRLKAEGKIQFAESAPGGLWFCFPLQLKEKPFDNKLVRQAMAYACDRAKICKLAFSSLIPPAQTRYVPGMFWYNEKADHTYDFDLDKAKAKLKEAGMESGFETEILCSDVVLPGTRAACQIYAQDLEKIGIKARIDDVANDIYYARYPKYEFKVIAMGTGDGRADPSPSLNESSFYRATNNKCSIELLPTYDKYVKLIADLGSTADMNKRKPIYDEIQLLQADECWSVTFAIWTNFFGLTPRVRDFKVPPDMRVTHLVTWLAS